MAYIQKFPSCSPLAIISDHKNLPSDSVCLGSQEFDGKLYSLLRRGNKHISILKSETYTVKDGTEHYYCKQQDFPIEVLGWFPSALQEFRKPPAQGGLHAGAMISDYADVGGEMLTVGRTTEGYALTNWSRSKHGNKSFAPMEIDFDSQFLFEQGFLELWQDLAERYRIGAL